MPTRNNDKDVHGATGRNMKAIMTRKERAALQGFLEDNTDPRKSKMTGYSHFASPSKESAPIHSPLSGGRGARWLEIRTTLYYYLLGGVELAFELQGHDIDRRDPVK